MRKPASRHARGATLLVVIMLVTVLLGVVASLMLYAGGERNRAVTQGRSGQRQSCAESGLQLARSYYGRNYDRWGTYLAAPSTYDPVASSFNTAPADPRSSTLQTAHPELFADVDGDGALDVYLYIRDNEDEFKPLASDWTRDNDQVVVVGSVCISRTLMQHRQDGTQVAGTLALEGLLSYNGGGQSFAQGGGSGDGTGNLNR